MELLRLKEIKPRYKSPSMPADSPAGFFKYEP